MAGILGTHGYRAEGELVPSGVGCGEWCFLLSRLGGLGSDVSSPSGIRGRAPAEKVACVRLETGL